MEPGSGFDASTYGRSFADVYDTWYPDTEETEEVISYIENRLGTGQTILELGIGTGRLALPLAERGFRVCGVDSSPEMLAILADKAADRGLGIATACADACDGRQWPPGQIEVVVAAFNFVFNLTSDDARFRLFRSVADRLVAEGSFLVETAVPVSPEDNGPTERRVELKDLNANSVVLIASSTDHRSGLVTGQHIELRDGEPVRLRPWRVQVVRPAVLDEVAARAGLHLVERHADWSGTPFDATAQRSVARYARATLD